MSSVCPAYISHPRTRNKKKFRVLKTGLDLTPPPKGTARGGGLPMPSAHKLNVGFSTYPLMEPEVCRTGHLWVAQHWTRCLLYHVKISGLRTNSTLKRSLKRGRIAEAYKFICSFTANMGFSTRMNNYNNETKVIYILIIESC